jgi:hypothetical protein
MIKITGQSIRIEVKFESKHKLTMVAEQKMAISGTMIKYVA